MRQLSKWGGHFILIVGHSRSGTSVCTTLLNQHRDINIGFEVNNQKLVSSLYDKLSKEEFVPFPPEYNGNKICLLPGIEASTVIEAIEKRNFITCGPDINLIITKRDPIDTIVSIRKRDLDKGRDFSLEVIVRCHREAEKIIRVLKVHYPSYHVFDFDKAVSCEFHRKWLFDFLGLTYQHQYSDKFRGVHNYPYGSINRRNTKHMDKTMDLEIREKIKSIFDEWNYWPWENSI